MTNTPDIKEKIEKEAIKYEDSKVNQPIRYADNFIAGAIYGIQLAEKRILELEADAFKTDEIMNGLVAENKALLHELANTKEENEKLKIQHKDLEKYGILIAKKHKQIVNLQQRLDTSSEKLKEAVVIIEHNIDDYCNCKENKKCIYHQFLESATALNTSQVVSVDTSLITNTKEEK